MAHGKIRLGQEAKENDKQNNNENIANMPKYLVQCV